LIENENGILRITDGVTEVLNTSTDALLHYLPPRIDGTVARARFDWVADQRRTRNDDFQIGTLPPEATHIMGLVRVTYGGGYTELPGDAWFVAGGTFVLFMKAYNSLSGASWGDYVSSIGLATIYKNGNELRFKEELSFRDGRLAASSSHFAAYTLTYRIYPAVFS